MWPKALLQLLELAPHVTRLVPMADRYLQSKAEGRDTQRRAMVEMAAGLRGELARIEGGLQGDLSQLAAAQAGIYHQLNQQSEVLAGLAADMRATRLTSDEMDARLLRLEKRISQVWMMVVAGLILFVLLAAGLSAAGVLVVLHNR